MVEAQEGETGAGKERGAGEGGASDEGHILRGWASVHGDRLRAAVEWVGGGQMQEEVDWEGGGRAESEEEERGGGAECEEEAHILAVLALTEEASGCVRVCVGGGAEDRFLRFFQGGVGGSDGGGERVVAGGHTF
jgi:hypothetical protein